MLRKTVALAAIASILLATLPSSHAFAPNSLSEQKNNKADPDTTPLVSEAALTRLDLKTLGDAALPQGSSADKVQQWLAKALGVDVSRLEMTQYETDQFGLKHVRFSQVQPFVGGKAKVLGGDVIVHITPDGGKVYLVTGTIVKGVEGVQLPPTVSKAAAAATAVGKARGRNPDADVAAMGDQELTIVPSSTGLVVAWCSETDLHDAPSGPQRLRVCSNGHGKGEVKEARNVLKTGTAFGTGKGFFNYADVPLTTNSLTTTSGNGKKATTATTYELRDPSRGGLYTTNMAYGTRGSGTVFTDADNKWGSGTLADAASVGVDAHYGSSKMLDYLKSVFGRNGVANNGVGGYSRVHYSRAYNNAFWSDGCMCMTYGDGDGTNFNPFMSLDVAGHEMMHGVTSRTANLNYAGESGGLNEAISDMFGTLLEFYVNSPSDAPDYLIGEKLYKSGTGALRYMYRPSKDGVSPDCWSPTLGSLDVHYSSGPANHWFFLLAEGSGVRTYTDATGSPTCNGATGLTGIGRDKAAAIVYYALTRVMTSSTNYAQARVATLNAAATLYGQGSAEWLAVGAAWSAVNVN